MTKFIILMYAGLMLCLAGCQEKHETPVQDPGLRLENSVVNVSAEGGTMSVAWTVENPIDGMNVDLVPDYPEWLNRFDVSVEGKISFNVDEYTGQETREAVVAVNYGGGWYLVRGGGGGEGESKVGWAFSPTLVFCGKLVEHFCRWLDPETSSG